MKQNVTFSIGNLALINKTDAQLGGYLNRVFGSIGGKAKDCKAFPFVLLEH